MAVETINKVATDTASISPDTAVTLDRARGAAGIERTQQLIDAYDTHRLVTPPYGPRAVDMVSTATLEEIAAVTPPADVHMHIAQSERPCRACSQRQPCPIAAVSGFGARLLR